MCSAIESEAASLSCNLGESFGVLVEAELAVAVVVVIGEACKKSNQITCLCLNQIVAYHYYYQFASVQALRLIILVTKIEHLMIIYYII